ncbi:uncharacterized protein LOC126373386 [Pectinophora gossypiella]|uniref:uncharacterized protein LOC126373386 n=1 Tax=Pectinophora gossypiella TaxID=13191 RepID=UPI00214E2439|nr:uncharacterized protein LOC126373386 [Pectinophora gossypiella]
MQREGFNCSWNLETGTFIFAVTNAIVSSLGFIASAAFTIYAIYIQIYDLNHPDDEHNYHYGAFTSGSMVMTTTGIGISVAFAVILCIGICQRKAEYVKWYFVYGVAVIAIALGTVLALVMFIIDFYGDEVMIYSCIALSISSLLFALILLMIRATYKKFEREIESTNHYGQLLTDK